MSKKENKIKTAKPMEPGVDKFPTWFDFVVMILIFLVASMFGGGVLMLLKWISPEMDQSLVSVFGYSVSFILAIGGIYAYRRRRGGVRSVFHFSIKWYNSSLVLLGIVLLLASSVVMEPLINLFPDHYLERLNSVIGRGGWAILMTVALAPVFEEMLFRGLILESARQKWGASAAIVISAVLFGLVHAPILPQMLNAFVVGIMLGYIYVLTDSLVSVIIIHAVNNGLSYMLLEITGNQATDLQIMIGNDTVYRIVYIVSLVIFLAALVSMAIIASDKMRKRAEITSVFTAAPGEEKEDAQNNNNV